MSDPEPWKFWGSVADQVFYDYFGFLDNCPEFDLVAITIHDTKKNCISIDFVINI